MEKNIQMKNIKYIYSTFIICFLLISCSQQTAPPVIQENINDISTNANNENDRLAMDQNDSDINFEDSGHSIDLSIPQPEAVKQAPDSDPLNLTSWDTYMILPGDFLIKIAKKEYGNYERWKEIYDWNKKEIGNNPNLIYPYHYLSLKKAEMVEEFKPGFSNYKVNEGETLWDIAGKLYGDPVAWIILYLDNAENLNGNSNSLSPGTILQVRDEINPKV